MTRAALAGLLLLATVALAQDPLDPIREQLVGARFEQALAAIESRLAEPGLTAAERADALVLRAQAQVSLGDLRAAERTFEEILRLRPDWAPDPALLPAKAIERFERVRAKLVGRVRIVLEPPDAALTVDGEPRRADLTGTLRVLAGAHLLRGEAPGHDPAETRIEVGPDQEVDAHLDLVPNARTVVVRTEPDGVEVLLDGEPVGVTARRAGEGGLVPPPAELELAFLPLGEHRFELRKPCYRTERLTDTLAVDLLDRAPKRYRTVEMLPARARLVPRGGPADAEVRIDGSRAGRLPAEAIEVCPGERSVEVRLGTRVVWSERLSIEDGAERTLEVTARPNVALIGADSWPADLAPLAGAVNLVRAVADPPSWDPASAAAWRAAGAAEAVDLAIATLPADRPGAAPRRFFFSPILDLAGPLAIADGTLDRPAWTVPVWGVRAVDDPWGGPPLVVEVLEGGPAAAAGLAPGDRVIELGGRPIADAATLASTLRAARADRPLPAAWTTAAGERRAAPLAGRYGPSLVGVSSPLRDAWRAAWAAADVGIDVERGSALANLALLLEAHGALAAAIETWQRIAWDERRGVGAGTRDYHLGVALERIGREEDARAAYRRAAASRSTASNDEGPPIAPAAADRLADLGVPLTAP